MSKRDSSNAWRRSVAAFAVLSLMCFIVSESVGWTHVWNRQREVELRSGSDTNIRTENRPDVDVQPTKTATAEPSEPTVTTKLPLSPQNGFLVTSALDDGSRGTLRWALNEANLHHGEDTITFDSERFAEPQTITLKQGPLVLVDPAQTTITGPPAGLTISGDDKTQVFVIGTGFEKSDNAARAFIADLTIARGRINEEFNIGGGVLVRGGATLTLSGCTLRDNAAPVKDTGGGAVFNAHSTLLMTNCTLTRNEAVEGGAVKNYAGVVKATNCTFVDNSARAGGGIYSNGYYRARTEVNNCLFSNANGGDLYLFDGLEHTGDYNLSSDGSAPGSHSIHNTKATLGPLGRYRGPTETVPLLTGSPGLDVGDNDRVADVLTDQRGLPRVTNGKVDVGAFEVQ